jgi:hypothetical protein
MEKHQINKMDDNRLAKIAKNGTADTFKPPGQPAKR